jgi:hypothetical protein
VLEQLSAAAVILGLACALYLTAAVVRHPQQMWIMNLVWPITALYFGPFAIWAYYAFGRRMDKPFWQSVAGGGRRFPHPAIGWLLILAATAWVVWVQWFRH